MTLDLNKTSLRNPRGSHASNTPAKTLLCQDGFHDLLM